VVGHGNIETAQVELDNTSVLADQTFIDSYRLAITLVPLGSSALHDSQLRPYPPGTVSLLLPRPDRRRLRVEPDEYAPCA
jgi:hypothetical protein